METAWKKYRRLPWCSAGLVLVNVLVFLAGWFGNDSLYQLGGLSLFDVTERKEYWRLFSAMFLHGDLNHLFNNMLVVLFMGGMIEERIGHGWFLLFYLSSGVGGNLLSLGTKAAAADYSLSIGASGGVFGLTGILLALVLIYRGHMPGITLRRVLVLIALSLYNGIASDNIDNWAHLGGLVTGFVLGLIFSGARRFLIGREFLLRRETDECGD